MRALYESLTHWTIGLYKSMSLAVLLLLGVILKLFIFSIYYCFSDKDSTLFDIDYSVYTQGAKYLLSVGNPFEWHTYWYTPLLAYIMVGNIKLHYLFGIFLFFVFDFLNGLLIYKIQEKKYAKTSLMIWTLSPIVSILSSRGSFDTMPIFFMLFTIYLLQKDKIILAALVYGFSVHFKLFPIMISIILYKYIQKEEKFFNQNSIKFALVSGLTFILITLFFYIKFGYQFLYESLLYHFIRKDPKHNYSFQFLIQYLYYDEPNVLLQQFLNLPVLLLIIYISFNYQRKLFLGCFLILFSFIHFSKILTPQYFLWYQPFYSLIYPQTEQSVIVTIIENFFWYMLVVFHNYFTSVIENKGKNVFVELQIYNLVFLLYNSRLLYYIVKRLKQNKTKTD